MSLPLQHLHLDTHQSVVVQHMPKCMDGVVVQHMPKCMDGVNYTATGLVSLKLSTEYFMYIMYPFGHLLKQFWQAFLCFVSSCYMHENYKLLKTTNRVDRGYSVPPGS